jgi:hypothetical protein
VFLTPHTASAVDRQGDQKVPVHLMITIQKVTSNAQTVSRQFPDIYWHAGLCSRRPCSVQHGPHSECILWWPSSNLQLCGNCKRQVHRDFLITLYIDTLPLPRGAVRRKRPENWRTNSWFLIHNNAPAHRSALAKDFLAKNNVTMLEHPPYSFDLI